jgi:hypothetical protein
MLPRHVGDPPPLGCKGRPFRGLRTNNSFRSCNSKIRSKTYAVIVAHDVLVMKVFQNVPVNGKVREWPYVNRS